MLISRPVTFALSFSLVLALLLARPASAMPFGIMFESDANDIGGSELAFNTYQTFNDILDANSTSSIFSDINVNAPFSTTGITWDGSQFIVMFESDANNIGGSELAFNTYQTFNDILDANSTSSMFSNINVNAPFSTTGITWDGSQFIVMFESDANNIGGSELAFNTYQTFNDILDANSTSSMFSDINVNAPFSTTGLFIDPAIGVPEPASAWLMMLAMAALWRARKSAEGAW